MKSEGDGFHTILRGNSNIGKDIGNKFKLNFNLNGLSQVSCFVLFFFNHYMRASLVAQMVKNMLTMQQAQVQSLDL